MRRKHKTLRTGKSFSRSSSFCCELKIELPYGVRNENKFIHETDAETKASSNNLRQEKFEEVYKTLRQR